MPADDIPRGRQNEVAIAFGRHLRTWRLRSGMLPQEKLGHIAGLHRTEVGLLERGRREPKLSTIVKLADAFGVSPAKFLEEYPLDHLPGE